MIESMLADIKFPITVANWSFCNWMVGGIRIRLRSGIWFYSGQWTGFFFFWLIIFYYILHFTHLTLKSLWMLLIRRFISISNNVPLSMDLGGKLPVCIQMHRFSNSWLINTVLLISCSTTVVKYESRISLGNVFSSVVNRSSSSFDESSDGCNKLFTEN